MEKDLFSGPGFYVGLALGVIAGWITLWSYLRPVVGRIVARIIAVGAIGIGVNWMVTPLSDYAVDRVKVTYTSAFGEGGFGMALGWGGGALAFGLLALVFSFLRIGDEPEAPKPERGPRPHPDLKEL